MEQKYTPVMILKIVIFNNIFWIGLSQLFMDQSS